MPGRTWKRRAIGWKKEGWECPKEEKEVLHGLGRK